MATYRLTGESYIGEFHSRQVNIGLIFAAPAVDTSSGEEVTIYWLPRPEWAAAYWRGEAEDDGDACLWDSPDYLYAESRERDYWGELTEWGPDDVLEGI